jgi:tRNA-dihydrouridine synthase A
MTLPDLNRAFCVAPMMDWTDRHCRAFHRALCDHALLYTEMVTADAVLRGQRDWLLGFSPVEHPVALQLGGSDPDRLAQAARIAAEFGYDEVNLNVGCPSDRVQSGRFGACLMREPALVADCLQAMREAVRIPVTVKHRLGVDDQDPHDTVFGFVETLATAGTRVFIVHARKAWLKGLSPKENRDVPPLDYSLVYALKAARPDLEFILNGGLETVEAAAVAINGRTPLDGVMLGRAAWHEPALLGQVDRVFYGSAEQDIGPVEAAHRHRGYLVERLDAGTPLHVMTRCMLGLMHGLPGARAWRRALGEDTRNGAGIDVFDRALDAVESASRRVAA